MIWFGKSFIKFCKSFIDLIKLVSTRTCSSARVRPAVVDIAALTLQIRVRHRSRSARGLPSGPLGPWVLSWAVWPRHQSTTARWRRLSGWRKGREALQQPAAEEKITFGSSRGRGLVAPGVPMPTAHPAWEDLADAVEVGELVEAVEEPLKEVAHLGSTRACTRERACLGDKRILT